MSFGAWGVLGLWATQYIGHLVFADFFQPMSGETWLVVVLFCFMFCLGDIVSAAFFRRRVLNAEKPKIIVQSKYVRRFLDLCLLVLFVVLIIDAFFFYRVIVANVGGLNLSKIRGFVINDFVDGRVLGKYIVGFGAISGACIYLLAQYWYMYGKKIGWIRLITLVSMGLVAALLTTGRLYLLLFVLSGLTIGQLMKIIGWKQMVLAVSGFLVLFFVLAFAFQKGDRGSPVANLAWNIRIYGFSSLGCFNDFLESHNQVFESGLLIPNPARNVLRSFGVVISDKPNLLPFAWIPEQCNTYTVLYPIFHDLGYFGIVLFALIFGTGHGYIWRKARLTRSVFWVFLCGISTYPLFMMVFEDAYFSSPGFWMILLVIAVAVHLMVYIVRQLNTFLLLSIQDNKTKISGGNV